MLIRKIPHQLPLLAILVVIVAGLTVGPVVMLIVGSFSQGIASFGAWTTQKYVKVYTDPNLSRVLLNTTLFVIGAALFSTVLGTFLAYLSVRTNIPLKQVFQSLPVIPMVIPHVLFAAAWIILLNPTNGVLNLLLRAIFRVSSGPINIYSLQGMIFLEGLLDLPVTYMVLAPAMYSFDVALEEVARVSGASNALTLRKVTLPMLRPAILAAFTLSLVRCLGAFAVPSMVGMPARIYVLTTHIYRIISVGWSPDYGRAAAIGLTVLMTSIMLILLYRYLTAESSKYVTVTGKGYRPTIIDLGKARYAYFGVVSVLIFILILIPIATLIYISLVPYPMIPNIAAFSMIDNRHWQAVLKSPIILRALRNTVILSVSGATLGMFLSTFVAYAIVKIKSRVSGFLESLSFLAFSFPGMIIGVGFIWFLVRTPLYGMLWALLVAYIGTYLPYGVRPMTSAFIQIHNNLEDSARVCGASFLHRLRRVIVPLVLPGITNGWILLASMFIRELSVSVVLSRPGTEVLTVQAITLAYDGLWGEVAALGLIMIGLSTIFTFGINILRQCIAGTT